MMTKECPHCGKDDQIRKVTAIVNESSSTANYSDLMGTLGGTGSVLQQTVLARKLMPPKFLGGEAPTEYKSMKGCCLLAFLGVFVGTILLTTGLSGHDDWMWITGAAILIFASIFSFFKNLYEIKSGNERRRHEGKLKIHSTMRANYESARQQWESAYYCGRCDGVFIPGSSEFTPIDQFEKFLHKFDEKF